MTRRYFKVILSAAVSVIALSGYLLWPHQAESREAAKNNPKQQDEAQLAVKETDLSTVIEEGSVSAEFHGNGKDVLKVSIWTKGADVLNIKFPAGQIFLSQQSRVLLPRETTVSVRPGKTTQATLFVVSLSDSNVIGQSAYSFSTVRSYKLEPLLDYLKEHPEVSEQSVQVAVLALCENLPVGAFAKFSQLGADISAQSYTDAYRAEVVDIISALQVLKEIGVRQETLALALDPQLKIEAMIDPLAHALAMRYYEISMQDEWAYWKEELLKGDISTRHYALYGIARFFPEVAIEMLPKWALDRGTNPVYRNSAIQAIAETNSSEALAIIRQLQSQLTAEPDLAKTARVTADYLERKSNRSPELAVNFRISQGGSEMVVR